MTLNGEMAAWPSFCVILPNLAVMSSFVLVLWSWRFLVLVFVLFNNVLSCIMLLVTKLHKNLSHHESTIA